MAKFSSGYTPGLRAPLAGASKQLKAPGRIQKENSSNDLPTAPNAFAIKKPAKAKSKAGNPSMYKTISQAMLAGK